MLSGLDWRGWAKIKGCRVPQIHWVFQLIWEDWCSLLEVAIPRVRDPVSAIIDKQFPK